MPEGTFSMTIIFAFVSISSIIITTRVPRSTREGNVFSLSVHRGVPEDTSPGQERDTHPRQDRERDTSPWTRQGQAYLPLDRTGTGIPPPGQDRDRHTSPWTGLGTGHIPYLPWTGGRDRQAYLPLDRMPPPRDRAYLPPLDRTGTGIPPPGQDRDRHTSPWTGPGIPPPRTGTGIPPPGRQGHRTGLGQGYLPLDRTGTGIPPPPWTGLGQGYLPWTGQEVIPPPPPPAGGQATPQALRLMRSRRRTFLYSE